MFLKQSFVDSLKFEYGTNANDETVWKSLYGNPLSNCLHVTVQGYSQFNKVSSQRKSGILTKACNIIGFLEWYSNRDLLRRRKQLNTLHTVARDTKTIVGLYFEINITSEISKRCDWSKGANFTSLCFMVRLGANHKPIALTIPARRIVNICKQSLHRHHVPQRYNWDGESRALSFLNHTCRADIKLLVKTPSLFLYKAEKSSSLFVSTHLWTGSFANKLKHREVSYFLSLICREQSRPDQTQALVKFWNQGADHNTKVNAFP